MLEFIVGGIVIVFILYILHYIQSSFWSLVVNIVITIFLMLFVGQDLRKRQMHNYYLISLVVVAVMFILRETFILKWLFYLLDLGGINIYVQALLLMFVLPNCIKIVHKKFNKNAGEGDSDEHGHQGHGH